MLASPARQPFPDDRDTLGAAKRTSVGRTSHAVVVAHPAGRQLQRRAFSLRWIVLSHPAQMNARKGTFSHFGSV